MTIYICRWPNGDFSIVNAESIDDAIVLLDEWGDAEEAELTEMSDCMFDFRLDDEGEFELAAVGDATFDSIMETCYPELDKARPDAERDSEGDYTLRGREQVRAAVEAERNRLKGSAVPREAETELGREIQKQTGAPSVLVNRMVRDAAKKRL